MDRLAHAKQLELLNQTLPGGLSLAEVLWVGMTQPDASVWREIQATGHRLGITLRSTLVADQAGLQRALNGLSQSPSVPHHPAAKSPREQGLRR
jgi:hypothetical protein